MQNNSYYQLMYVEIIILSKTNKGYKHHMYTQRVQHIDLNL